MAVAIAYGTWAWSLPTDTNEAELITPASGVEYIGIITVCEQSGSDRTYRLAFSDNGTGVAASTKHWKKYDCPLLANLSHEISCHINSSISVRVRSSSGSAISFVLEGMKKTTT